MPKLSTTRQCSLILHIVQLCLPILLLIGVFVLLYLYVRHWNITHPSEAFTSSSPSSPSSSSSPVRVYWTGGFDSTFRVLQAVLDEHRTVTPYYLSGDIDNAAARKTRRRNRQMEFQAMNKIRDALAQDFPEAAARLNPTVVVEHVKLTSTTRQQMRHLAKQKVVRRPTCQYGSLGQYALQLGQPIEIGIVRDGHSNAGIYAGLQDKIAGVGASCRLTEEALRTSPPYALFRNCVFPLMHLQKPDMLRIAKEGGYDHLLLLTWSCWYPTPDNRPCNRCLMCRERVLNAQGESHRSVSGGHPNTLTNKTLPTKTLPSNTLSSGGYRGIPVQGHRYTLDQAVHHPVQQSNQALSSLQALPALPALPVAPDRVGSSEVVLGRTGGGGAGGGFDGGGGFGPADQVALGYR